MLAIVHVCSGGQCECMFSLSHPVEPGDELSSSGWMASAFSGLVICLLCNLIPSILGFVSISPHSPLFLAS